MKTLNKDNKNSDQFPLKGHNNITIKSGSGGNYICEDRERTGAYGERCTTNDPNI